MKKWIRFEKLNDLDAIVKEINYVPDDPLYGVKDREKEGIYIESDIPKPNNISDKNAILHINTSTFEFSYTYENLPKNLEKDIQSRMSAVEMALANMMGM